jgi:hypothetical protein
MNLFKKVGLWLGLESEAKAEAKAEGCCGGKGGSKCHCVDIKPEVVEAKVVEVPAEKKKPVSKSQERRVAIQKDVEDTPVAKEKPKPKPKATPKTTPKAETKKKQ